MKTKQQIFNQFNDICARYAEAEAKQLDQEVTELIRQGKVSEATDLQKTKRPKTVTPEMQAIQKEAIAMEADLKKAFPGVPVYKVAGQGNTHFTPNT